MAAPEDVDQGGRQREDAGLAGEIFQHLAGEWQTAREFVDGLAVLDARGQRTAK